MSDSTPSIDPRVLGKLLLIQTTLHAIPTSAAIAEFVCRGLEGIPGTSSITVRIHDLRKSSASQCRTAEAETPEQPATPPAAPAEDRIFKIAIRTLHHTYGDISLETPGHSILEPYRPFLESLANTVALTIENRENEISLKLLNEGLESAVRERTRELVAANEALRESERRLREMLETVQLIACILDDKGNVLFVNDYLLKLTGWRKDEVVGSNWFDRFIPADETEAEPMFFRAMRESAIPSHYSNAIVTRKGEKRMVSWNNTMLRDSDGRVMGTTSIGIDVTDQRKVEEQLRQAQKMEAIGQLAGGIAHDFNNVLAAIVGYGSVLQMKMRQDDPFRVYIEHILSAAERASGLTQSLLAFSRKQVIHPDNIDLNDSIKNVDKFLSRIIGEDISLIISPCVNPLTIFADSIQIEQVLMNLATNARDAMPRGGSLIVTTERVDGATFFNANNTDRAGAYAMVSVTDTGTGMDEQTQAKIFEPFFTTKEVGKGTGLGLAIVYGIVKQNNGHITVYSEAGKGTTFKIYFPLIPANAAVKQSTPVPAAINGGSETILLAEDDKAMRELALQVLTDYGYHVIDAEDGDAALRKFHEQSQTIQLIITDVIMPKKSGRDLYEEARKMNPDIKVIFTSGYPSDFIQKEGVIDRTLHFISKPSSPQILLRKIREVLDQPAL